jgi:hypothetical protein
VTPWVSRSRIMRPRVRSAQMAQTDPAGEYMLRVCRGTGRVSVASRVEIVRTFERIPGSANPRRPYTSHMTCGPRRLRRGPSHWVRDNWRTRPVSIAPGTARPRMPTTTRPPARTGRRSGCAATRERATLRP